MRTRGPASLFATLLLGASLAGAPARALPVAVPPVAGLLYDEALAAVEVAVPEFAGAWLDAADGTLAVALTRPDRVAAEAARGQLARQLGRPDLAGLPVSVRQARYSFGALKGWHDAITAEVLADPGAVSTDVDERAGVVRVGMADPAGGEARVRAIAAAHGVPDGALIVEREAPVRPELDDLRLPVVGGQEIGFVTTTGEAFTCTLGFVAVRQGVTGFVTNSHCTGRRGELDGTVHTQPAVGVPIGVEAADPAHFAGGACPVGRSCRYSDSAFSTLPAPVVYDQGRIARPPLDGVSWNGEDVFQVVAEGTPVLGETLTKVGRTTGRTQGAVSRTCANYNVSGSALTMVCQSQADYLSSGGDSGSPVFALVAGSDVALKGIHWGGGGVFSPIANVQRGDELGPLTTCYPGYSC